MSGQAVTFIATVTTPVVGVPGPTGTVTFKDGSTTLGTSTLSGNTATFTTSTLSVGSHSITAAYGGAPNFAPSTSGTLTQVVNMPPYTFTGFLSPLSTAGSVTSPTNSGTGNFSKGLPIKWQLKDSLGNFVTNLTSTQTLKATYYGAACGSGQATGTTFTLYQPTTGATGGSTFRYDSNNNQYLFNWSTKSVTTGPGCYEIILRLNDGSPGESDADQAAVVMSSARRRCGSAAAAFYFPARRFRASAASGPPSPVWNARNVLKASAAPGLFRPSRARPR